MPAEDVFRSYRQQLLWMMGAFGVVFAMVLVSIHRLIHRLVVKPIGPMVRLTQKISQATDPQGCEVLTSPQEAADLNRLTKVARQGDELGQLAGLFRQMASALAEREQSVQQMVRQIRYETAIATQRASGLSPTQSPANLINLLQQSRQSRLQVQIADPTRAALLAAPSTPDLKQLLRQVRSFQSFGDAELSDLLQLGHHEQWDGQQQICQEDEIGTAFYIVLTGSVEVLTRHSPPDTSPVLKQLQPGDFFGEVSLMLGIPRIASVQTLEPTTLFVINQTNFQQLLQTYPHLAEAIAQQLAANKAAFDQRQASLRRHGLIPTSTSGFAWRDWIRDRIRQTFKI
jgi:CRP-like cAMP-binding protein/HAMP domain-containing protein